MRIGEDEKVKILLDLDTGELINLTDKDWLEIFKKSESFFKTDFEKFQETLKEHPLGPKTTSTGEV